MAGERVSPASNSNFLANNPFEKIDEKAFSPGLKF
jgi:hypothetical protein